MKLSSLRQDLSAGLVVFLVALPLCLGIALASDAPLISGIVAGVIGGVLVGGLSGSRISVSGPAAGLTVLVATAIRSLGSFQAFLAASFLAGVIQLALGFFGAGVLGALFPVSVIRGMLSAIGLIIILKQIPHALGRDHDFEGDLGFWEIGGENTFTDIVRAVMSYTPGAILLFSVSMAILLFWERPWIRSFVWSRFVPGPLVAVISGSVLNGFMESRFPSMRLDTEHMVRLPSSFSDLLGGLSSPAWSALGQSAVWITAAVLALIASIETLLAVEATDKLDPEHHITPTNRELMAQGVGNMLSALFGGLPVTSVIVRSSANLYAGARSKFSAIAHGLMMAVSVALIPHWLNRVPLATLAAVLIMVGGKLASPKVFKKAYSMGWEQFAPFVLTVFAIIFTDLLRGVLLGSAVGIFIILTSNFQSALTVARQGKDVLILFTKDVTFIHKIRLLNELSLIEEGCSVLVDGTRAHFIDHDVYELLEDFAELAAHRGIRFELRNVVGKQFTLSTSSVVSSSKEV